MNTGTHKALSPEHAALLSGFAQWLDVRDYAARSIKNRLQYVRQFLCWLGPARLSPANLRAYSAHLQTRRVARGGGLSAAHINAALSSLNVLAGYLHARGRIATRCRLARLAGESKDYLILRPSAIGAMQGAASSCAQGLRDRALLAVLYGAGLRVSEASGLNLADVDTRRGLLRVERGKGGAARVVPLTDAVVADLSAWLASGRPCYRERSGECGAAFFLNRRGARLGIDGIAQRVRHLARAAGLAQRITPHSLRHSIATHLLEAGMELGRIAAFLGHRSIASTQVYTHILERRDAAL